MEKKRIDIDKNLRLPIYFEKSYVETSPCVAGEVQQEKWIVEGLAAAPGLDRKTPFYQLTEEALQTAVNDFNVNPTVFLEHDKLQPVGRVLEAKYIPGQGIWIKALISKTAYDVWTMIQEGVLTGFSIGAGVKQYVEELGKTIKETIRRVTRLEIREVSVTALPANVTTRIWSAYIQKALTDNSEGGESFMEKEFEQVEAKEEAEISKGLETEKPAEVPAVEIQKSDEKPAEVPPVTPAVEKPAEVPAEPVPAVEKPAEVPADKPADEKPAEQPAVAPAVEKPAEVPAPAEDISISKALDDIKKELETFKANQQEAIKAAVKEALATVPDEIRKSMIIVNEEKEKAEVKPDTRTLEQKMNDALSAQMKAK